MEATAKREYVKVLNWYHIDGAVVVITDCADYDAYRALPDAIEVEGHLLGKTGWNSDRGTACFKSGVLLARKVR